MRLQLEHLLAQASLPNVAHGDVRIAMINGSFRYREWGLLDRTHVRFFTLETARQLFQEAGLVAVETKRVVVPLFRSEIGVTRADVNDTTLDELFKSWLENYAKAHKKLRSWEDDQKQFDRYLTDWKARRVSTITETDVRALHLKIGTNHGKYSANRLLALLSSVFNFSKRPNPTKGVEKYREKSRDRFLHPDEIPRFIKALTDEPNETVRDFIWLCLLTGGRRSNVQEMRWDEVSLERATGRARQSGCASP